MEVRVLSRAPKQNSKNHMMAIQRQTVLKWILVAAIVIVLNLFFVNAIRLALEEPQYDDFCAPRQVTIQPDAQDACVGAGGAWTDYGKPAKPRPVPAPDFEEPAGYCDLDFTCRQEYEDARTVYNRNVFVALVVLGVFALVAGFFIAADAVSLGFSLGGVLALIIASIRYWSDMNDVLRVVVLAVALAALVWLGIKKVRRQEETV